MLLSGPIHCQMRSQHKRARSAAAARPPPAAASTNPTGPPTSSEAARLARSSTSLAVFTPASCLRRLYSWRGRPSGSDWAAAMGGALGCGVRWCRDAVCGCRDDRHQGETDAATALRVRAAAPAPRQPAHLLVARELVRKGLALLAAAPAAAWARAARAAARALGVELGLRGLTGGQHISRGCELGDSGDNEVVAQDASAPPSRPNRERGSGGSWWAHLGCPKLLKVLLHACQRVRLLLRLPARRLDGLWGRESQPRHARGQEELPPLRLGTRGVLQCETGYKVTPLPCAAPACTC
jgi:hypothetical protein